MCVIEQMVLREILHRAREAGIQTLVGVYRPSDRNSLVRDHYRKLGFNQIEQRPDGTTIWTMQATAEIDAAPMTVRHLGHTPA